MTAYLTDNHIHSRFSADSEADMREMVEAARRKGFRLITFTDHIDWDFPVEDEVFDIDLPSYDIEIQRLRREYSGKIRILKGVELGLQPHLRERYAELTKSEGFDYVIGSRHLVGNMDPYYPETFAGKTVDEIYRQFFRETLECLETDPDIDALGHLDYIVRYGHPLGFRFAYSDFADIIDEILKVIIAKGIALEVNTCGLRKTIDHTNPHPDIVRRYRELGGEMITIGSDAHKMSHVGFGVETAEEMLKDAGFDYIVYFEKRKPQFIRL